MPNEKGGILNLDSSINPNYSVCFREHSGTCYYNTGNKTAFKQETGMKSKEISNYQALIKSDPKFAVFWYSAFTNGIKH